MRIALYEPDIPQNTGTILRLAACLGVEAHIIEPAGFPSSDRAFRRAGMDYLDQVSLRRHSSWAAFEAWRRAEGLRLVLFTTAATMSYLDHGYRRGRHPDVRPRVPQGEHQEILPPIALIEIGHGGGARGEKDQDGSRSAAARLRTPPRINAGGASPARGSPSLRAEGAVRARKACRLMMWASTPRQAAEGVESCRCSAECRARRGRSAWPSFGPPSRGASSA